jgi:hypothetical protein
MAAPQSAEKIILGISFFQGSALQAVQRMSAGGLLVVPAAPALKELAKNASYREALLYADLTIPDSAFMVIVWNWLQRDSISRLSGLEYLRELLKQPDVQRPGNCVWIMANPLSAQKNLHWLARHRSARGLCLRGTDLWERDFGCTAAGAD